jgi:hypothetical protein
LTTFGGFDIITNIHLYINDLTPAGDGQDILAKSDQVVWFCYIPTGYIFLQ